MSKMEDESDLIDNQNSYLIAQDQLNVQKILGKGSYGEVFLAIWKKSNEQEMEVAVKRLHNLWEIKEAFQEIENMQKLKHVNVVRLYGITIRPIQVVFELCEGGSLIDRLKTKPVLLVSQLLDFTKQLCAGMKYLESRNCIHRDLAARNVLLTKDEKYIKISDFGLSRFLSTDQTYYYQTSKQGIPYLWYPPEAMWDKKFSHKSDVWSYAITVWEMFTYGELPWDGRSIFQVLAEMNQNKKLCKPEFMDNFIYKLMCACWENDKDLRPSFTTLQSKLKNKEFATAKCIEAQKLERVDETLYIECRENDEIIILYESQPNMLFGQNIRTKEFGHIHREKIKNINDAVIEELEPMQIEKLSKSSLIEFDQLSKNVDSNKLESVRVEAFALGRTNLFIQIDDCYIVMYPRSEDLATLKNRDIVKQIDCVIGCPPEDVIKVLNNRFPQIVWITWQKESLKTIQKYVSYINQAHLTKNYTAKKLRIKDHMFKMYKSNHGYIINGPTSNIIFIWPHELSTDTIKQIKSLKPFNVAFFCINSFENPEEVKSTIDLINAQKNILMFAQKQPIDKPIERMHRTVFVSRDFHQHCHPSEVFAWNENKFNPSEVMF